VGAAAVGRLSDLADSFVGVTVNRPASLSSHFFVPGSRARISPLTLRPILKVLVASIGFSNIVQSQQPTARDTAYLDSVLRAHRYTVTIANSRLAGDGAPFLIEATKDAQFFMIGESHYVAEIPRFTAALFADLHRAHGYNYYAVENGPVIMRSLSSSSIRGNTDRAFAIAKKYPHAFQFWDDQEIQAYSDIGRISTARTEPLWGLDQEWGALHVLDRLVEIAPTKEAQTFARTLSDRARPIETVRPFVLTDVKRFISDADSASFKELRSKFRPTRGSEADFLIDALELSNRVYLHNDAAGRGEVTGYAANSEREQYMKSRFMAEYRRAQKEGDSLPRVLLKFGNVHGGDWLSLTYVHTLGEFVHEFAISNAGKSFHLVAWLLNDPGTYWSIGEDPAYALLARVGSTKEWTIVDLRPLRDLWYAGKLKALSAEMRKTMFAFDAVLLVGNGTRGAYDRLRLR